MMRAGTFPGRGLDNRGQSASRRTCGFSLIELLVALTILALLAAAATPLWMSQIQRARRLDATDALMRIAVLQERFHFENGRYALAGELAAAPPAGLGASETERGYYQLRLQAPQGATANRFTAQAVADPNGPQARDEQCRTLALDSTGLRQAESATGEDTTSACWP